MGRYEVAEYELYVFNPVKRLEYSVSFVFHIQV